MTSAADSTASGQDLPEITDRRFFGHPMGLAVLFFAEMWERFSYYGMRALLTFYLTKHWLFSDGEAGVIYGAYTALVYITPVLGGYLADRYLGQRKAVLFGAVLLTLGHFFMGFEGDGGGESAALNVFWLALAFIIVGSGFLKANISVIVGQLYPLRDVRRDGAYTIFYMGINLGAAGGALLCGWLGEKYGWSYGFGAAGVGMLLGLLVFIWGKPLLMGRGEAPSEARLKDRSLGLPFEWILYGAGVAAVGLCWYLIQNQDVVGALLWGVGLALILFVLGIATFQLAHGAIDRAPKGPLQVYIAGSVIAVLGYLLQFAPLGLPSAALSGLMGVGGLMAVGATLQQVVTFRSPSRDRIFAATFLMVGSILFWALFEQAGSSLSLLTDRMVDRSLAGTEVPASMFQSINAIYIILLAPVFASIWTLMGRRGIEPSAPAKFGLAMVQLGAGFLVLVHGAEAGELGGLIPVIYILLIYLLHTTGELCLSPVGLSAMNRLAPAHLASIIMGTWFFASATGNFVAGKIAAASGSESLEGGSEEMVPGSAEAISYVTNVTEVYTTIGWAAVIAGGVVVGLSPLVKKMMHLDTLGSVDHALAGESELAQPQAAGVDTSGEGR